MTITKEALEKAYREILAKHNTQESVDGIKTLDEIEKTAFIFSNDLMQRAIELALEEQQKKVGKKKL